MSQQGVHKGNYRKAKQCRTLRIRIFYRNRTTRYCHNFVKAFCQSFRKMPTRKRRSWESSSKYNCFHSKDHKICSRAIISNNKMFMRKAKCLLKTFEQWLLKKWNKIKQRMRSYSNSSNKQPGKEHNKNPKHNSQKTSNSYKDQTIWLAKSYRLRKNRWDRQWTLTSSPNSQKLSRNSRT